MNEQKYYYQSGFCTALHYSSLNPVIYESEGEGKTFHKRCMGCEAIRNGKCEKKDSCQYLEDAPECLPYNYYLLRKEKMK